MIRQWVIVVALGLLLVALTWDFVSKVVLYDPLAGVVQPGSSAIKNDAGAGDYSYAWSSKILSRNIFSAERKPDVAARVAPQDISRTAGRLGNGTKAEPMPAVRLSGIIQNTDGSLTAYLKVGDAPVTGTRTGDVLQGFAVVKIEERLVQLRWGAETLTLEMQSSPMIKKR